MIKKRAQQSRKCGIGKRKENDETVSPRASWKARPDECISCRTTWGGFSLFSRLNEWLPELCWIPTLYILFSQETRKWTKRQKIPPPYTCVSICVSFVIVFVQDVVRRQLRINGARVPISLHVDSPSPSGEDEREDSDGAPRKPLKSMTELFSKSSGTVVNVRVSTGKSDQASKLPVTQAIAADDNDAARKALGEEGGVDLDKNIHTRSLPAIVDVHIGPAEPHSTASASFADPASETVQSEADSVRRPHRVSIERNLASEEEIIERHQQERRATLGLARAQHSMEHQKPCSRTAEIAGSGKL